MGKGLVVVALAGLLLTYAVLAVVMWRIMSWAVLLVQGNSDYIEMAVWLAILAVASFAWREKKHYYIV